MITALLPMPVKIYRSLFLNTDQHHDRQAGETCRLSDHGNGDTNLLPRSASCSNNAMAQLLSGEATTCQQEHTDIVRRQVSGSESNTTDLLPVHAMVDAMQYHVHTRATR